jgi:hypothetical protein
VTQNANPLRPPVTVLVKLGSIAVHVDEMLSPRGHPVDKVALQTLLDDAELKDWLAQMSAMAMLPLKR